MAQYFDHVWFSTATTGTGTLTVGAALTGYVTPANASPAVVDGTLLEYEILDGSAWEHGTGTYTVSGTTLSRSLIASSTGSLLSLTGAATVFITCSASTMQPFAYGLTFGNGSDGNVTASGAVTLTRDMHYRNLTLSAGAAINTAGFRIFVSNLLDASNAPAGAIQNNGIAGNDSIGTAAGGAITGATNNLVLPTSTASITASSQGNLPIVGAVGSNAAGVNAFGGQAGISGGGGAGLAGANGNNGTVTAPVGVLPPSLPSVVGFISVLAALVVPGQFSANAGQGGGDTVNRGGGAGTGAGCGQSVWLQARFIRRGASTAAGTVQAKGGKGGNGGTPSVGNVGGGGAAGGGGGGIIFCIVEDVLGTVVVGFFDVSGGAGGNGGNGINTGVGGGNGGDQGGGGVVQFTNLRAEVMTTSTRNNAGQAGTTRTGLTGGTGGSTTVTQVNL